jgi:hypothetical protein
MFDNFYIKILKKIKGNCFIFRCIVRFNLKFEKKIFNKYILLLINLDLK